MNNNGPGTLCQVTLGRRPWHMCCSGEWPVFLRLLSSWSMDGSLLMHRNWSKKRRWIEYRDLLPSVLSVSSLFSSNTDLLSTLSLNLSKTSIPVFCSHRLSILPYHFTSVQISFESWDMVSKCHKMFLTIKLAS